MYINNHVAEVICYRYNSSAQVVWGRESLPGNTNATSNIKMVVVESFDGGIQKPNRILAELRRLDIPERTYSQLRNFLKYRKTKQLTNIVSLCHLAERGEGLEQQDRTLVCVTFVKQKLNFPLLLVCEVDLLIGARYSLFGVGSKSYGEAMSPWGPFTHFCEGLSPIVEVY